MEIFFNELVKKDQITMISNLTSRRFNLDICTFANIIYPVKNLMNTSMNIVTGHDGVFMILESDVKDYYAHYNPQIKSGRVTYYIRAFDGYDSKGEQIVRSMTWKPPENLTTKQIEKELQRQIIIFEESVKKGTCFDSNTRFAEYAEIWLENNKPPILAPKTYIRYQSLLKEYKCGYW